MQRLANEEDHVVEDMLEDYVQTESYIEYGGSEKRIVKYTDIPQGKVGLVSGGGSGHKPAFLGYIGRNMLGTVAIGEVFSSPMANAFLDTFREANHEDGVACLFGSYAEDNMGVKMTEVMAKDEEIQARYVTADDDISSSPRETEEKQHRIAGGIYMWKIADTAAAQRVDLDEVCRIAEKTIEHTRSVCIGLIPYTIPGVGYPNFTIQGGTYEFGIGHHGEPGMNIRPMASAEEIAGEMINAIHEDYELTEGDEVSVIVSDLGATPLIEQCILYKEVVDWLKEREVRIHHPLIGDYVILPNINDAAITVLKLDRELEKLLDVPAMCAAFQFAQQCN